MNTSMKKGIINIRKLSKNSLGLTIPLGLVKHVDFREGVYSYNAERNNNEIIIKLKCLENGKENDIS